MATSKRRSANGRKWPKKLEIARNPTARHLSAHVLPNVLQRMTTNYGTRPLKVTARDRGNSKYLSTPGCAVRWYSEKLPIGRGYIAFASMFQNISSSKPRDRKVDTNDINKAVRSHADHFHAGVDPKDRRLSPFSLCGQLVGNTCDVFASTRAQRPHV